MSDLKSCKFFLISLESFLLCQIFIGVRRERKEERKEVPVGNIKRSSKSSSGHEKSPRKVAPQLRGDSR